MEAVVGEVVLVDKELDQVKEVVKAVDQVKEVDKVVDQDRVVVKVVADLEDQQNQLALEQQLLSVAVMVC